MLKQTSFDSPSLNFGTPQENKLYNPNIKLKEDEKEWLQGNECQICNLSFQRCGREHHCRVCGKPVCKSCSNKMINDKRACDLCFMRVKMADQEKLKKQQIKAKRQTIKELQNNIQQSNIKMDELKMDLENLQKTYEIQELQHKIQLKQLDDQLKQKIEVIKQLTANNERQTKNIQVEQSQIKESEIQNEELKSQTSNHRINLNLIKPQIDTKQKTLTQGQQNLQNLKQQIVKYEEQQKQNQEMNSQISTKESKAPSDQVSHSVPKQDKHKECIIF